MVSLLEAPVTQGTQMHQGRDAVRVLLIKGWPFITNTTQCGKNALPWTRRR